MSATLKNLIEEIQLKAAKLTPRQKIETINDCLRYDEEGEHIIENSLFDIFKKLNNKFAYAIQIGQFERVDCQTFANIILFDTLKNEDGVIDIQLNGSHIIEDCDCNDCLYTNKFYKEEKVIFSKELYTCLQNCSLELTNIIKRLNNVEASA